MAFKVFVFGISVDTCGCTFLCDNFFGVLVQNSPLSSMSTSISKIHAWFRFFRVRHQIVVLLGKHYLLVAKFYLKSFLGCSGSDIFEFFTHWSVKVFWLALGPSAHTRSFKIVARVLVVLADLPQCCLVVPCIWNVFLHLSLFHILGSIFFWRKFHSKNWYNLF